MPRILANGNMIQVAVAIGRDQKETLDVLAAERRASLAQLVREAIDTYLAVQRVPLRPRPMPSTNGHEHAAE